MMPKFRAWDKRFSEFVEDFFVSEDGKIYKNTKDTSYGFAISRETSDKVILMQSTGLKDKNGKEIFEGDVVTFEDEIRCGDDLDIFLNIGVVEYGQGMFYISNRQSVCADDLLDGEMWDVEVIGNIYENPELLPK